MRNEDTAEIQKLNVLMNGPRVIWGRMPSLTLSLFILFTDRVNSYEKDAVHIPGAISYFVDKLVSHWDVFVVARDCNYRSAITFPEMNMSSGPVSQS